jgi:site-specific DNA-methyltransferase (adenine-specific)
MEYNKILQGDCLEVMKGIPDNYIDLTVTSPPYDNLRTYNGYVFDFKNTAKELYRITKQGGVVVWVVGDATIKGSETGTSFKQALYFKEIGFNLHDTMIWEKDTFSFPDKIRYRNVFEYMFIFSKGKPKSFNPIEDKINKYAGCKVHGTSRGKDGKTFKKSNCGTITKDKGVRFNVWKQPNEKNNYFNHPAPFPEKLAQDHIISWSNKGDIVLDPMCGSGTTCKMAKISGRKYIGIDTSKEYCEIARKRINTIPETLFDYTK